MPTVHVLLFASLREIAHAERVSVEIDDDATAGDLLTALGRQHPALAPRLGPCRVAVDQAFVRADHPLAGATELAVIPPVSGGHDGPVRIAVRDVPLSLADVVAAVEHPGAGGIATFTGNVRRHSRGHTVEHLEYEAYVPMAERVMDQIRARIEDQIEGSRVAIHHRIGHLEVGETAVVIAASAPHRAEAFAACREAIEALKRDVPIWKREVAEDGASWVGQGPGAARAGRRRARSPIAGRGHATIGPLRSIQMDVIVSSSVTGTLSDIRPRTHRTRAIALALDGGHRVAIPPEGTLLVGQGPGVGLVLDDPYVSARHAAIRVARDGVVVEDLGSKNGTWVDGVVVERAWARLGAVLRFGRISMRVVCGQPTPPLHEELVDGPVVGHSPAFRELLRMLERAARVRSPVLLRGETGTGKEMAARVVHRASERRGEPFVALNCGAIPEPLAESELFGHVKGAFTGAHRDRQGAFSRADGGTLLLDEMAELPLLIQAKLLRVLETGRILPVGAEQEQPVDVRIVAATHRDLEGMIDRGLLREDLYHRLGVLCIRLPPLRERPEDIPVLLHHFARRASRELGYPVELTDAALTAATRHLWPGNVRALRNAVFRAGALADGPIEADALLPASVSPAELAPPGCVVVPRGSYEMMRRAMLRRIVEEEGSLRRAALVLGVPRSTLGNWLRER